MPAAVANDSVVASERLPADEFENAEFVGHGPCFAFVNPHQWGVDDELFVHGKVECYVERTDKVVATVGVAGEVGLRDACHEVANAVLPGIYGRNAEEKEIATRNKGVGRSVLRLFFVHCERCVGECTLC